MDAFLLRYSDGGSSCVLCFKVPFYVGSFRALKRISLQSYLLYQTTLYPGIQISNDYKKCDSLLIYSKIYKTNYLDI